MEIHVQHRPSYALAVAQLEPNETIQVEAGSMVGMSASVRVETQARGGLLKSLARSMLGGESFFINTYQASAQGGQILLAPALPGDIVTRRMEGETLLVQSGSYVASSEDVDVSTGWGGPKTFFAREGLILLKLSGTGTLVLSSYGAIEEMELGPGESFTVDTGHLVAFSDRLGFQVRSVGGLKSTLFSGEGLVVDLTGPGRFWLQTRSEDAFLTWLIPKLPHRDSSD
jgi:uncharacterized protein (TIGR00266 family)